VVLSCLRKGFVVAVSRADRLTNCSEISITLFIIIKWRVFAVSVEPIDFLSDVLLELGAYARFAVVIELTAFFKSSSHFI